VVSIRVVSRGVVDVRGKPTVVTSELSTEVALTSVAPPG
jgi:hypothetical protein